jgi:predicted nucleic acid-binding protein
MRVLFVEATLTFFYASYLELAQRNSLPLATLDQALRRAAEANGTPLFTL